LIEPLSAFLLSKVKRSPVLCVIQLLSTDSTDSDVTPVHKPIIAAACHDVINEHLPLSRQRSPAPRDVTVQEVAVKVEQTDNDDDDDDDDDDERAGSGARDDETGLHPLDLTVHRPSDCESTVTNTSSSSDTAGGLTTYVDTTQVLLLRGERYEILPVGGGRWMSRSEYELDPARQNTPQPLNDVTDVTDDVIRDVTDDDDDAWSVASHNTVTSSERVDDVTTKTRDVSTSEHKTVNV